MYHSVRVCVVVARVFCKHVYVEVRRLAGLDLESLSLYRMVLGDQVQVPSIDDRRLYLLSHLPPFQ